MHVANDEFGSTRRQVSTGSRISGQSLIFLTFKEPKNWSQGTNSARLCSLVGRYDSPIPTRFLAPIDCLKIPALVILKFSPGSSTMPWKCLSKQGIKLLLNIPIYYFIMRRKEIPTCSFTSSSSEQKDLAIFLNIKSRTVNWKQWVTACRRENRRKTYLKQSK